MGSRSTTKTEIPKYLEDAGKLAIQQAQQIQQMGYMPYMGPEVAAVNPYEQAAAQGVGQMASAFGMAAPAGLDMGMPTVTQGGMTGYSSYPIYQSALERLREQRPEQYEFFANQTGFDPITGAATNFMAAPIGQDAAVGGVAPVSGGGSNDKPFFAPAPTGSGSSSGKLFGGFTSVKDMFDGGGAGASGDTYSSGRKRGPISKAIFGD